MVVQPKGYFEQNFDTDYLGKSKIFKEHWTKYRKDKRKNFRGTMIYKNEEGRLFSSEDMEDLSVEELNEFIE